MAQTDHQRKTSRVLWIAVWVLIVARVGWEFVPPRNVDKDADSLVKWVPIEEAQRLSASTNRPMLIDFTAAWCPPCHSLDAEVFRNPEMAKMINERFVPVRVMDRMREDGRNLRAVSELQQKFRVNGFPTVVFTDGNGNERERMEGYGGRERFRVMMESVR